MGRPPYTGKISRLLSLSNTLILSSTALKNWRLNRNLSLRLSESAHAPLMSSSQLENRKLTNVYFRHETYTRSYASKWQFHIVEINSTSRNSLYEICVIRFHKKNLWTEKFVIQQCATTVGGNLLQVPPNR